MCVPSAPSPLFSCVPHNLGTTIDGNSATGGEFSQSVMYEHCDGCLTGRRCKLNGVTLGASLAQDIVCSSRPAGRSMQQFCARSRRQQLTRNPRPRAT
jgi:hypothetical protein